MTIYHRLRKALTMSADGPPRMPAVTPAEAKSIAGGSSTCKKKFEHQLTSVNFSWISSSPSLSQLIQDNVSNSLSSYSLPAAESTKNRLNETKTKLDESTASPPTADHAESPPTNNSDRGANGHEASNRGKTKMEALEEPASDITREAGGHRGRRGGKLTMEEFFRSIDIYRDLRGRLRREFGAQCVSNAWLKMFEMCVHYRLLDHLDAEKASTALVHFDNCALPGAFLSAVNHIRATRFPGTEYSWRASSLVPQNYLPAEKHTQGYGMYNPLGDDFGLYAENPGHWMMDLHPQSDGSQCTGDMTEPGNVLRLEQLCSSAPAQLYSSDLGVSVGKDFNSQEQLNLHPHLGQDLMGILSLQVGGHFLVKHYTLFETASLSLLLILASLFKEFYVCKPVTSRPTNSETYLVGREFLGVAPALRALLLDRLKDFNSSPFLPREVMELVLKEDPSGAGTSLEQMFKIWDTQAKYLEESMSLYKATNQGRLLDSWEGLTRMKREREQAYLQLNDVRELDFQERLRISPKFM